MDTSIFIPTRVANQHKVADWQQGEDVTDFMLISTWINDITIPLVVSMIHMYHPAIYFGCVATKLIATCQSFDTLLMYIHRKMCTYVWHHLWKYAYKKKKKKKVHCKLLHRKHQRKAQWLFHNNDSSSETQICIFHSYQTHCAMQKQLCKFICNRFGGA